MKVETAQLLPPGWQILASCFDAEDNIGGGLFAYDGSRVRRIDRVSSTGLHRADDTLLRVLWSDGGTPAELLVYDERGIRRYHRLDGVSNPHDVRRVDGNAVVVATAENEVVWLSPGGEVVRRWKPEGEPDSWHLNGLIDQGGRLLVSAFGRFGRRKGWDHHGRPPTGCLVDVETGGEVISGLTAPHSPRFAAGAWFICNSAAGEVVEIDARTGAIRRRARLGGWPRGLAVGDRALFVGVSPERHLAPATEAAKVVLLDRESWQQAGEVPLPAREVYDVELVPTKLAEGARRGFASNATREREQAQLAMFREVGAEPARLWAIGDPLPTEACRAALELGEPLPSVVPADALFTVRLRVRNRGSAIFTPAPPNPVRPVHEWFTADGGTPIETETPRAKLPRSIPPGGEAEAPILVRAPDAPGSYRLRLTLAQEGVARFDELDPGSGLRLELAVR